MKTEITKELIYSTARESFGIVPGVIKEMAERSAHVGYLYLVGNQIMAGSGLNEIEINAIELKVSLMNHCDSCIKGHSFLLKKAGLADDDIQSILGDRQTSDHRLNTLLTATEYLYHSGSDKFPDLVLDFFETEEIPESVILEIIALISLKTISNFTNNYLASVRARVV